MCKICDNTFDFENDIILDCSNCDNIKFLPESIPNLEYLCIYNTNIENIPKYDTLKALYAFNSKLKKLPYGLTKLNKLNIDNTLVELIPDNYIRLQTLYANNTKINDIPESLINLQNLEVANTDIESLSNKFINLDSLVINNTKIKNIPDSFQYLRYLNINNTEISQIPNTLSRLNKLYCKNTQVDPFILNSDINIHM